MVSIMDIRRHERYHFSNPLTEHQIRQTVKKKRCQRDREMMPSGTVYNGHLFSRSNPRLAVSLAFVHGKFTLPTEASMCLYGHTHTLTIPEGALNFKTWYVLILYKVTLCKFKS